MGKKVMKEASLEIPPHKNIDKNNKLNSLIKVLKPKVYITDSASFKKLVQELTGNETSPVAPSPPPPPPPPPPPLPLVAEKFPVIAVDEDVVVVGGVDSSSMENSGCCSSSDICNLQVSLMGESRQVEESSSEEAFFPDMTALDSFPGKKDVVGFEEMDSWLLQIDPFNSSYGQSFEEAACIYDYDLAGVI